MRLRLALVGIAFCQFNAGILIARGYLSNPDRPVDARLMPFFSPVVVLRREREVRQFAQQPLKIGRGTGFYISPCYLITNWHVVFGDRMDREKNFNESMRIYRSPLDDIQGAPTTTAQVANFPEWPRTQGNDWVILRDDTCKGNQLGWFTVRKTYERAELIDKKVPVYVASFPGNFGELRLSRGITRQFINTPDRNDPVLGYDASTHPGSSGGVVFTIEDGYLNLIGLHSGAKNETTKLVDNYSTEQSNYYVGLDMVLPRPSIQTLIRQDIVGASPRNPAAKFLTSAGLRGFIAHFETDQTESKP